MNERAHLRFLVTGATGLIGADIIERLLAGGHCVLALRRSRSELVCNSGERLDPARYEGRFGFIDGDIRTDDLAARVSCATQVRFDAVIHAAALTQFGLDPPLYTMTNVEGTRHVVRLCRHLEVPLLYVSTSYVCGLVRGEVPEALAPVKPRFGNPYEESKFEAERIVAASGLPYCILRPSIIVGRRGDGRIREFKQIYVLLRALTDGKVSAIPGEYDAVLNLVPCDHVAEAIATVACRMAAVERRVMHVAAREDVSFLDFSNVLAEYPALRVPRYLGSRSFDVALLEPLEQKYYRKLVEPYGSYFTRRVRFGLGALDCVSVDAPTGGAGLLREIIAYAESARYLGRQCYA